VLKRSIAGAVVLVTTTGLVGAPATATAAAAWHRYVLGPSAAQVAPVSAEGTGNVANPHTLVTGKGKSATLTTVAGQTPASVVLDFGKDLAGTPFFDVTAVAGAPALTLVTGEARSFLRRPAATTVAVVAAVGATTVTLASAANLEVGNTITIDTQAGTITAFDPTARTVSFGPALSADMPVGTAVSTSPGAPASDEARGLAGVGGPDTLQPTAPGRMTGTFHGGFRFILLTLSTPGSVSISSARVDFQALRATPADYRGHFLSSDDQLNRMWYSGAYTLQLNLKPAGRGGLPDARIYDGAKRDRSIWTCDMLVQAPTAISTLGTVGAEYVKSSLNVILATQRADGALPGSPDFRKGPNPAGSPLFYSNNYSGCGIRGVIAYYRYTGDEAYLRSVLPAMRAELAYNATFLDANNLVVSNDRDFWQATQTARSPSTASTTTSCSGKWPGSSARSATPPLPTATTRRPRRSRPRSTPGCGTRPWAPTARAATVSTSSSRTPTRSRCSTASCPPSAAPACWPRSGHCGRRSARSSARVCRTPPAT
jgi:hypothetical protein